MKSILGWAIPVVLIVVLGFTVRAYASALGRADAARTESTRLTVELGVIEADTVRLSQLLTESDVERDRRAREDSIRIAVLDAEAVVLAANFDALVSADSVHAEGVEVALTALTERLAPEDLPSLRTLTDAYETRLVGLGSQVQVQQDLVTAERAENEILRGQIESERTARSAADALLDGLRGQVFTLGQIVDSKDVEIAALRDAVAPGFITNLFRNAKLVSITAAVSATLTFVLTQ